MESIEIVTPAGLAGRLLDLSVAEFTHDDRLSLARRLDVLTRLEAAYKEAGVLLRAREQFLDESEIKLFEKVQEQQEKETDLEQREEDLCTRSREWRERVATVGPFSSRRSKPPVAGQAVAGSRSRSTSATLRSWSGGKNPLMRVITCWMIPSGQLAPPVMRTRLGPVAEPAGSSGQSGRGSVRPAPPPT